MVNNLDLDDEQGHESEPHLGPSVWIKMIDWFKNIFWYIMYNLLHTVLLYMAKYFPVPQKVYDETVCKEPH